MIAKLTGCIDTLGDTFLILDVGGGWISGLLLKPDTQQLRLPRGEGLSLY
jgi:hypothetical protein